VIIVSSWYRYKERKAEICWLALINARVIAKLISGDQFCTLKRKRMKIMIERWDTCTLYKMLRAFCKHYLCEKKKREKRKLMLLRKGKYLGRIVRWFGVQYKGVPSEIPIARGNKDLWWAYWRPRRDGLAELLSKITLEWPGLSDEESLPHTS